MESIRVEFTAKYPCEATPEQIQEWVEYCLGIRGGISMENPLHEYDLEGETATVLF